MEIKIDLDMNKIDYDAINKQIQEKIAALDIKDMYNVETRIENKISNLIDNEVDITYNKYIKKSFWDDGTTDNGRKLIEDIIKTEIEKCANKVIEEIGEEKLRELMFEFLPDIFSTLLFEKMRSALFYSEHNYRNETYNMVRSQIDSAFSRMRY